MSYPRNNGDSVTEKSEEVVLVVDNDELLRYAIANLIAAIGLTCQTFASASEFLEADLPNVPRCLVLDVRLPV